MTKRQKAHRQRQPLDPLLRICTRCYHTRPASAFVRKSRNLCKICRNADERQRRINKRHGIVNSAVVNLIKSDRGEKAAIQIVYRLATQLGGPDRLAEQIKEVFDAAMENQRPSIALRCVLASARISALAKKHKDARWEGYSDADLEELGTEAQLAEAIGLLESHGYRVTGPHAPQDDL